VTPPGAEAWRFRCVRCGGEVPVARGTPGQRPTCAGCGATYDCENGIISVGAAVSERDYPVEMHQLVAAVEEEHFWFSARNRVILSTMRRVLGPLEGKRLLDVGCGSGFVLSALEHAGLQVAGTDMHGQRLVRARTRIRGPLLCSNAATLPFFDDFDLVGLFDVIEHTADDAEVLRQARLVLRPGGHVVVTAPAGTHAWTRFDEVIGHKRRYDRRSLADALARGGFRVRHASYFNCLPHVAQRLHRRFARAVHDSSTPAVEIVRQTLRVPPEPLNTLFGWAMRLETPLRVLPFVTGGSLIAIGERAD